MKCLHLTFVLSFVASFGAFAASGDFKDARLDSSLNSIIILEFKVPVSKKSILLLRNWAVHSQTRDKQQEVENVRAVLVKGTATDSAGQINPNLPPEALYYSQAELVLKKSFQPGWAYKAIFKLNEISAPPKSDNTIGDELESDWLDVKPSVTPGTNNWQVIDSLHGPSLSVDVRNAQGGDANIGIDYDFRLLSYDPIRFDLGDTGVGGAGIKAGSKGYLKNESSSKVNPKLDSIISSFDAFGDILLRSDEHLATFLTPQVSFKNEANQNFKTSTYTIGAGTSFDLGFLLPVNSGSKPTLLQTWNFLDLARTKRPIDSPRFYVGYDRVFNAGSSSRSLQTGDPSSEFNRLAYGFAWGLPVLNERSYLTASWSAYQDLDASKKAFHSLLEISLTYALTDPKIQSKSPFNLLLKYINGSLPPNFGRESGVVAGLSIKWK